MAELQLVYQERTFSAPLDAAGIELGDSDEEVLRKAAYHFDVTDLSGHVVTRPATGNVLVHEKAVYGRSWRHLTNSQF